MLSRIAENFYWIGRYVERVYNTVCLLDVTSMSVLENTSKATAESVWQALLKLHLNEELFYELYPKATERSVHEFLIFSLENPNSVLSCVKAARENMRCVRNRVSNALWLLTNEFYLSLVKKKPDQVLSFKREPFCRAIRNFCVTFNGCADNSMTREESWQFLRIGRSLERSIETTHLLELKCRWFSKDGKGSAEIRQWVSLLRSVDGVEAYYQTYLNRIEPESVVELLLLNKRFPRSVKFTVSEIESALKDLPHNRDSVPYWLLMIKIKGILTELMTVNASEMFRLGVTDYLEDILKYLYSLNDLLYKSFFVFPQLEARPEDSDSPYEHSSRAES